MKYLQNNSTDPHFNMAFDEFCLEHLKADEPVFYLWLNRPSVIIGLNQSAYAEVNLPYLQEKGILLARRVTGGGAVYHDLQNLNYTITGRIRDFRGTLGGGGHISRSICPDRVAKRRGGRCVLLRLC
jgi:Lipoate-protein ligase A